MFNNWENYYLIVGSLAGALIGIMFVVATLTAGLDIGTRLAQSARVFITPIVFHFSVIVVVSAIAAVPDMPSSPSGAALTLLAALGLIYSALTTIRMFHGEMANPPDWSDKFHYAIAPTIICVAFVVGAIAVWSAPDSAANALGAIMLVLLLLGIRNAWDLATFIVQRTSDKGD